MHGSVRRVAIADLVGEVPPLQSLVTGDDGHGISDSFLYGVSLNKIARPLEGSANVFLMPSGTEAVATEAVYRNERWRKLAAGFHQVGALLLVVARPDVPGFDDLCNFIGAVFPIGSPAPTAPAGVQVVAMPRPTSPEVARVVEKAREVGSEDTSSRRRKIIAAIFATAAIALLVGILWPQIVARLPEPIANLFTGHASAANENGKTIADSTKPGSATPDSISGAAQAATDTAKRSATGQGLVTVANPADSARAAAYTVYLVAANTRESAISDPRVQSLPALTISPVILGGNDNSVWFRLTVGASEDEASAEALLARLRAAKVLGPTAGSIYQYPYAFRLAEKLSVEASAGALGDFTKRGISAYALKQADGKISIFTGAFESVAHSSYLGDSLRTQGVTAVLVYRTGR
ncbi:MAG: SPOR domain-containing protein, partial [Gemmatimonadaceae bacterium]